MPLMDCLPPETLDLGVTLSASSIAQLQADGITTRVVPAVQALWTPPTTPNGITGLQLNIQPVSGDAVTTGVQKIENAQAVTTDAIMAGASYDVAWRAVGDDGSVTEWSDPVTLLIEQDFRTYSPSGPNRILSVTTDYTLEYNDRGGYVRGEGGDITVTVPLYADVPFPLKDVPLGSPTCCVAVRCATGTVTVVGADGVTVNPPTVTLSPNGLLQLVHVHEDEWDVVGNFGGASFTSGDISAALGYTPLPDTPTGVISGTYGGARSSAQVTVNGTGQITAAQDIASVPVLDVYPDTSTTLTLETGDLYSYKVFTDPAGVTVTVPTDADAGWDTSKALMFAFQQGPTGGTVTVAAAPGVTINTLAGLSLSSYGPNAVLQLVWTDTDTWTLFGAQA